MNSWIDGQYIRYRVIPVYDDQLEVCGWSVWDSERMVEVISTETVCNRDAVQTVCDYFNAGVLVHHVEG